MARTNTLFNAVITTALTASTTTPVDVPIGTKSIAMQSKFTVATGGSTVKVWFQTTFDDGVSWIDVTNHAFTTSAAVKVSNVITGTTVTPVAPTDAALADNTNNAGLIGSKIRLKITTTGTYTGSSTLTTTAVFN